MEKIMNFKHHGKQGQRHRPRDAFELYELEHMPRRYVNISSDNAKPHDLEIFRSDYRETGRMLQRHWRPPEDVDANFEVEKLERGQQRRHRPRDAFELYELEHMPRAFIKISSGRAKPHDLEVLKPDNNGDTGIYNESIDAEAEKFIASKHEKFELGKWMSMNGY